MVFSVGKLIRPNALHRGGVRAARLVSCCAHGERTHLGFPACPRDLAGNMSVPQTLKGRYEIREILGKGGMGVVYRAWDNVIRRDVALKTMRDSPSREALDLFRKECAVLAQVSHPNIIEIFDLGELEAESGAKPYFVMPLMNGQTLDWTHPPPERPPDGGARRGHRLPDLPGAPGGAREGAHPPRRQAQQHLSSSTTTR